ncbi:MAG TPA: DPP IV N-terminal domain-containing protein [Longimicrobiales bacterium]|nr:DPP IV N-terminal domain-containing protein [Longimicrobiales bacterium]
MTKRNPHIDRYIALCALLLSATTVEAQRPVDAELRRIFASREFEGARFGPARWLDGDHYTTLERSTAAFGFEIVRYDAGTGARDIYVGAAQLTPPGATAPLQIADYSWSGDGNRLLIFTNTAKVWRDNTRGDYWVLDRATGKLQKLGGSAPASTMMFAKFTPDGSRVGYVQQGDIYVQDLNSGDITRITSNASHTLINGTTDWVYEEELYLRDAFLFSPDGSKIAYWQFDMSGVRDFLLINNTDSTYSYTIPFQYPKAGTTNSSVRVGVVNTSGGNTTWIKLPGDARENYIPRMAWAGPNEVVVQHQNRQQNTIHVMLANASTGDARVLFTEQDSAWIDVTDVTWLDANRLLWVSERDGWRHAYAIGRDGSAKLLTTGSYDIVTGRRGGTGIDVANGFIYFIASPNNATQRYLFRTPIAGGNAQRLTPASQPGTHSYSISPNVHWAIHTTSTFDRPAVIDLVELPAHRVVRTLIDNQPLRNAVSPLIHRPTEFFKVNVGGAELDGWMILPRDFDASKKYPLFVYVYSEPASQTVLDSWGGERALWHRMLADQGYIVVSIDNSGTPAPKGRAWRKSAYANIGVLASREQADAVRALAGSRSYIDSTRVGIWGWSGGGGATLNALFRYPDVYKMGMSVAPVPDLRLYDTIYQERYMGLPQQNVEAYKQSSPITFAEGLRGNLLLVHGSGDDNVHYQGTERLVNRLVALNKQFEFMAYPNRSHCICEGPGTTLHIYTLLTHYLLDHLPAGAK